MLHILIILFDWIKNIGIYSIIVSYKTGQLIVSALLTCTDILNQLFNTLWTLLIILNEDLLVFIFDVWNKLSFLMRAVASCIEYLTDTLSNMISSTVSFIFSTFNFIAGLYQAIVNVVLLVASCIGSLFSALKQLIVLFGSGMWFAVTIVPISIVYISMLLVYSAGRIFEEIISGAALLASNIISSVTDLVTFVIDVPLESVAGLLICACLAHVVIKFNIVLYGRARNLATSITDTFINVYENLWRSASANQVTQDDVQAEISEEEECDEDNIRPQSAKHRKKQLVDDNRLCVICMERNKCMLAMPCRHLCTCSECQHTLQRYTRTCPICRRYVNYTIHVY